MGEVKRGQTCHITFFTEELKSTPRTVSLELDIEKATSFVVGFAGTSYSFDLPAGKDTYSVDLTLPTEDVSFYAADSDMKVLSFSIR